jgi:hypothetical protein
MKSKLPDLKELASMTGKLFTDIKKSVCEIVQNYKDKRAEERKPDDQQSSEQIKPKKKPVEKK